MIWFLLSWSHNRSKTLAWNPKYGYLKRRLSSRWSFGLNSARGSKETTTIERTHPTLVIARSPCRGLKMIAVVRERRKRTRRTFQGNNLWKSTTLRTPGNHGGFSKFIFAGVRRQCSRLSLSVVYWYFVFYDYDGPSEFPWYKVEFYSLF